MWCFIGFVNFSKPWSKFHIFNNRGAYFSVGKIIYWVANFEHRASLIYLAGKITYKIGKCSPSLPVIYGLPRWVLPVR